jgi:AAA family ATP:ADP antiporter
MFRKIIFKFQTKTFNKITTKRFYTFFSLFGNSALVLVGFLMMNLASEGTIIVKLMQISDHKITLVQVSLILVIFFGLLSCWLVRFVIKNVMTNPSFYAKDKAESDLTLKLGLKQSFLYIARSKYLWIMLVCSASFGLSMNLVEAVWKAKIKELYPTVSSYAEFNSLYILWTGVAIMVMTVIGNNVMRAYSWFVAAIITPIIIMITGIMFFIFVVFDKDIVSIFDGAIIMSPLALAVSMGGLQNVLAKGAKYSIWDTSKEMLYIPLEPELKVKGKAAVDVISSKIGKSSSGLIQSLIFTIIPTATLTSISPYLMVIFAIVCYTWIIAVRKIYFEYVNMI